MALLTHMQEFRSLPFYLKLKETRILTVFTKQHRWDPSHHSGFSILVADYFILEPPAKYRKTVKCGAQDTQLSAME